MINERAAMLSLHDVVFVRFGYVRSLVVYGWVVGLLLVCVWGFMSSNGSCKSRLPDF